MTHTLNAIDYRGKVCRSRHAPRAKWNVHDRSTERRVLQHYRTPELWCVERVDGQGRLHTTYAASATPPEGDGFFARLGDALNAVQFCTADRYRKRVSPQ